MIFHYRKSNIYYKVKKCALRNTTLLLLETSSLLVPTLPHNLVDQTSLEVTPLALTMHMAEAILLEVKVVAWKVEEIILSANFVTELVMLSPSAITDLISIFKPLNLVRINPMEEVS